MKSCQARRTGKLWIAAMVLAALGFWGETGLGMIYRPVKSRSLWDVWVLHHEGLYYLYYLSITGSDCDGISLATSVDGVHWDEFGEVIEQADDAVWCGGVATFWKVNRTGQGGTGPQKFFTNFSEWRGPTKTTGQQAIFFAESDDLVHWKRLSNKYEFKPDTRWYKIDDGVKSRWDGMCTIERPEGGYYGYLTACSNQPGIALARDGSTLSFGFAHSPDTLEWEALRPPEIEWEGKIDALTTTEKPAKAFRAMSVGDVQRINGKIYLLNTTSAVLVADQPEGPFRPAARNLVLIPERKGRGNRFPRFVRAPEGLLYAHHDHGPAARVHCAPIKRVVGEEDGTIWLAYWNGNDKVKGPAVDLKLPEVAAEPRGLAMFENSFDTERGVIVEGTMTLPAGSDEKSPGLVVECRGGEVVAIEVGPGGVTEIGVLNEDHLGFERKGTFDREMEFGKTASFRLLLRSGLLEFYLGTPSTKQSALGGPMGEILIQCYALPERASGKIGLVTGAQKQAVRQVRAWEMSLPPVPE